MFTKNLQWERKKWQKTVYYQPIITAELQLMVSIFIVLIRPDRSPTRQINVDKCNEWLFQFSFSFRLTPSNLPSADSKPVIGAHEMWKWIVWLFNKTFSKQSLITGIQCTASGWLSKEVPVATLTCGLLLHLNDVDFEVLLWSSCDLFLKHSYLSFYYDAVFSQNHAL